MNGQSDPPLAAGVRSGAAPLAGGSFRRALRAEALRRAELTRPASPVTGRVQCPPYRPVPRRAARTRPSGRASYAIAGKVTRTGDGTPRIVRAAPSTCKGTRRSFLTAPQKGSSGPTLARGASSDPAGLTARARPEARPRGAWRTCAAAKCSNQGNIHRRGAQEAEKLSQ